MELFEKIIELTKRLQKVEQENKDLRERLQYLEEHIGDYPTLKSLCDGIQTWISDDFAQDLQTWITEEYSPEVQNWVTGSFAECLQEWIDEYVTKRLNGEPSFAEQKESEQEHD